MDYIKKCNKIKQFDLTDEELVKAVKLSSDLEFDEATNSIRRKGNKALPMYGGGNKKVKTVTGENGHQENSKNTEEKEENPLDFSNYDP